MASRHKRPVREHEVRVGHTYYMPVPAHQLCRGEGECACRKAGVEPGQGCSPVPGGCMWIYVNCREQADMARRLLKDGMLLYRSKAKAKQQGRKGNWLRKWTDRSIFKKATN